MIKAPFVKRKTFENMRKAYENQLEITKYWQARYAEAYETQNTLNAMLKAMGDDPHKDNAIYMYRVIEKCESKHFGDNKQLAEVKTLLYNAKSEMRNCYEKICDALNNFRA